MYLQLGLAFSQHTKVPVYLGRDRPFEPGCVSAQSFAQASANVLERACSEYLAECLVEYLLSHIVESAHKCQPTYLF